jgi:hypothetical protein
MNEPATAAQVNPGASNPVTPDAAASDAAAAIPAALTGPGAQTELMARADALVRRMAVEELTARPDPIDPAWCQLVRRRGGMSLGAGRAPRAVVELAVRHGGLVCGEADVWKVQPHAHDAPAEVSAQPLVNERESPLQWLARRKGPDGEPFLSPDAVMAGERLRADATEAAMLPSVTANWSRMEDAAGRAMPRDPALASDRVIAARQRVRAAHRCLGPGLGGFTLDVCAFLVPLQVAETARGWPARSGKVILRLSLEQLARHYGVATEATGPERARLAGWRGEERATMDGWL